MRKPWPMLRLASAPVQIIDGDRGKNYPKHGEFADSGYCLFLNAGNVTTDGFNFSDCQFISEGKDQKLRKGKLISHDVVMTTRGTVGNVGLNNGKVPYDNIRINSGMVIFRPDPKYLSSDYFYHYLRSPLFKNQVNALKSGVAQPQLPIRDINHINMVLPPLDEQEQISNILSAYDDLIENNRRRIELLEQAARLLYQEWFVNFHYPGHEHVKIVDGIREGWERNLISDICNTVGGGTPSTRKLGYWENGDIPWVVPTDVTRNKCLALLDTEKRITPEGLKNSSAKMLPPDTILMTSRASVGFFALMEKSVCTNQGFISIIPHITSMRMYILHNLIHRVEEIRSNAGGTTYSEISKGHFRNMKIIVPPMSASLYQQFNEITSLLFQQTRLLMKQNMNLINARDLLLPRLMSGEIAV